MANPPVAHAPNFGNVAARNLDLNNGGTVVNSMAYTLTASAPASSYAASSI